MKTVKKPFDCITEFMFFETEVKPADIILIPGGSHPQLMERAANLYHRGLAPYILPSGGVNPNIKTTEWNFLRNIGVSLGVPEKAILKEDKARNTFQNSKYSWEVIQSEGIKPRRAIIVCKNYHARRVLLTYQIHFSTETTFFLCPVIDKTGITKDNWFLEEKRIKRVMIEVEKIGKYMADYVVNWTN